jgi:ParB family chromosome partitioning protein
MISFDGLKDFDVAELQRPARPGTGQARELPVTKIYPDPNNVRRRCDEATIAELAETIRRDGLLQPITVRDHPELSGCYMISYGERRWRACRLLGRAMIAATIDNDFDPYRQAIENLQREDLSPSEIATFVAKREAVGDSRTLIAKRLGKPKSYISELAQLAAAPSPVKEAFNASRIDTRTAYLLTRHYLAVPERVNALLSGDTPVSRAEAMSALEAPPEADLNPRELKEATRRRKPSNALAVLLAGRTGVMRLEPSHESSQATVRFADGSEETVALNKLSLKHWVRL